MNMHFLNVFVSFCVSLFALDTMGQSTSTRLLSEDDKELMKTALQSEKNPGVACLMSLIVPGLGQMYNESTGMGLLFLGGASVGLGLYLSDSHSRTLSSTGLIAYCGFDLISVLAAAFQAESKNESRREAIIELKQRGISLSELRLVPSYSKGNLSLCVSLEF